MRPPVRKMQAVTLLFAAFVLALCGHTTTGIRPRAMPQGWCGTRSVGCGGGDHLDVIPSLARFRMPFRTVESEDDASGPELRGGRGSGRLASTLLVAASLRAQHRPHTNFGSGTSALQTAELRVVDIADRYAAESERACCVCQESFQPSADGEAEGALQAQLIECGHVFCIACLGAVLQFQGKGCAERTSRQCSACSRSRESDGGGNSSLISKAGSQRLGCSGWAPCPLCRNLYSRDQVYIINTGGNDRTSRRRDIDACLEDRYSGEDSLLQQGRDASAAVSAASVSPGDATSPDEARRSRISQSNVAEAIRYAFSCTSS